jgi:hypothetical protein
MVVKGTGLSSNRQMKRGVQPEFNVGRGVRDKVALSSYRNIDYIFRLPLLSETRSH